MYSLATVLFLSFYVFSLITISIALDTILVNQNITDGVTISSAGDTFELGFFSPGELGLSPGNSTNRYVGIWYKAAAKKPVVWVANREAPLNDSSGVFKVTRQGILVVVDGKNNTVWSSSSSSSAESPKAQLLETGNLVMRNGNDSDPEHYLWQSFDHPGDTLLPGMKLGWNRVTGLDRHLSSWKSADDPSEGNFTYENDLSGFPQLLLKNGLAVKFRGGPWNGVRYAGVPQLTQNSIYTFEFVSTEEELYFVYHLVNSSVLMRLLLTRDGYAKRFVWTANQDEWHLYSTSQRDDCDNYATCGVNGLCNIEQTPICDCMKGFVPKFQSNWDRADWSSGCVRIVPLDCQKGDGFVKFTGVKVPDTSKSWFSISMNLNECASLCLRNCSCTAYANSDIRDGGSGCLLWFHDLVDIRYLAEYGQDIYVRMAAAESDSFPSRNSSSERRKKPVMVIATLIAAIVLLGLLLTYELRKRRLKR